MDATLLAKELIDLHEHPRQVSPFSTRYPGLTAETGYAAASQLHGTLTDAHPVAPGERWSTVFEGLPLQGLSLNFEP